MTEPPDDGDEGPGESGPRELDGDEGPGEIGPGEPDTEVTDRRVDGATRESDRPGLDETEPDMRFEQPQDPVSKLVSGVRLWTTVTGLSAYGLAAVEQPRVGKYVLEEILGEGGMSVVFGARDPELGQRVALKMLKPRMARDQRERLLREGQALARIRSDHVVRVLDRIRHQGADVLVLERVHGVKLDEWLKRHQPDLDLVLDLMIQAARGLAAAHRVALVHRDVKPQNIMVTDDLAGAGAEASGPTGGAKSKRTPRVHVVDFGLVSIHEFEPSAVDGGIAEGLTETGALVGTLHYMAPEQVKLALTDARTDIFGFCVVLYQAIFKTLPFPGEGRGEVLAAICAGMPIAPNTKTRAQRQLWAVLQRGLAADPGDRFASMDALVIELERIRRRRDRATRWALGLGAAAAVAVAWFVGAAMVPSEAEEHLTACLRAGEELAAEIAADDLGDERLTQKVSAYRHHWLSAWRGSCEAEHVPEIKAKDLSESDRGLGPRPTHRCLEEGRRALKANLDRLRGAPADEHATIAEGLRLGVFPEIDECARVAMGPIEQGVDSRLQTKIDNARQSMLRDDQDAAAADLGEVIALAGEDHRPARARAEYTLARLLRLGGSDDVNAVLGHLRAAEGAAIAAHDDVLALQVKLEEVRVHTLVARSASSGRRAAQLARGWLERVDGTLSDAERRILTATLLDSEGLVYSADGRHADAVESHTAALAALGRPKDSDFDARVVHSTILINLGGALTKVGLGAEGLRKSTQAIEEEIALFGAAHNELVESLTGVSADLYAMENMADAKHYATLAIELARRGRRAVAPRLVLAGVLLAEKKFADAEREASEAAKAASEAGMVWSAVQADVILGSAMFGDRQEMCQPTLDHFEHLVRKFDEGELRGRDDLLAEVHVARMKNALECQRDELVLADFKTVSPLVSEPTERHDLLALKGQALARLGRRDEAIPVLRESLEGESDVPEVRRDATLALAKLLVVDRKSREEACELVRGISADHKDAQAWLQDHCA